MVSGEAMVNVHECQAMLYIHEGFSALSMQNGEEGKHG